jgi:hypothetical protein
MRHASTASLVAAAAVVLAGASATVVVAAPDALVDLVRRIDRLLESILDLLETVRRLFGGGGN